jgi:hypothetical protein
MIEAADCHPKLIKLKHGVSWIKEASKKKLRSILDRNQGLMCTWVQLYHIIEHSEHPLFMQMLDVLHPGPFRELVAWNLIPGYTRPLTLEPA